MITGPSEGLKIRGGHNLSLPVEIGLTDLPKSRVAKAPPAPPRTTPLLSHDRLELSFTVLARVQIREREKKFRQTVTVTLLHFVTLRRGLQSRRKNPTFCHIKSLVHL